MVDHVRRARGGRVARGRRLDHARPDGGPPSGGRPALAPIWARRSTTISCPLARRLADAGLVRLVEDPDDLAAAVARGRRAGARAPRGGDRSRPRAPRLPLGASSPWPREVGAMGSKPVRRPRIAATDVSAERRSAAPSGGRRHRDLVWATLIAALPHELRRSLGVISLLSDGVDANAEAGQQIALEVRRIDRLIDALTEVSRVTSGDGASPSSRSRRSRVLSEAVVAFARDPDRCEVSVERDDDLPAGPRQRGADRDGPRQPAVQRLAPRRRAGGAARPCAAARWWSSPCIDAGDGLRPRPHRAARRLDVRRDRRGDGGGARHQQAASPPRWAGGSTSSRAPDGSRVSLCLPVARQAMSDRALVLVVDDDRAIVRALQSLLEVAGYATTGGRHRRRRARDRRAAPART